VTCAARVAAWALLGGLGAATAACADAGADAAARAASDVVGASSAACAEGPTAADGAPDDLRCTGLYADVATKTRSPRVRAFAPAVSFWSDGADKERFIELPDGAVIDTSSMDEWRFPVGTKVWKEFKVAGRLVETRFFHKVRADRWVQAAYVWALDQHSAAKVDGADLDVGGASYRVPRTSECNDCHRGRRDKLLGFDAVSLAQPSATGLTLDALAREGRLSAPPVVTSVIIADDATGRSAAALAWLHVSCGASCHTGTSLGTGYGTGLVLRLGWDEIVSRPPAEWQILRSTVGVASRTPRWSGAPRVAPGDPDASVLYRLVSQRGPEQMPPIATNQIDQAGTAAVAAWISALPAAEPARGVARPVIAR